MMLPSGNKAQVPVPRRRLGGVGKGGVTHRHGSREPVLAYLCAQVDALRASEPGARIDSPDAVHGMRVASRRLRSSLATFGRMFDGSHPRHLRDELLWLGAVLGPVRDVEVMRDHLHGTAATLRVDDDLAGALAGLDRDLAQRHAQSHMALIRALDSDRYSVLLLDLTAFVGNPPWVTRASRRHTLRALVGRACARLDR